MARKQKLAQVKWWWPAIGKKARLSFPHLPTLDSQTLRIDCTARRVRPAGLQSLPALGPAPYRFAPPFYVTSADLLPRTPSGSRLPPLPVVVVAAAAAAAAAGAAGGGRRIGRRRRRRLRGRRRERSGTREREEASEEQAERAQPRPPFRSPEQPEQPGPPAAAATAAAAVRLPVRRTKPESPRPEPCPRPPAAATSPARAAPSPPAPCPSATPRSYLMTIAPRPGGRSSPPRREVSAGRPAAAPSLQPVSSAASPPASRRGPLIQGVSKRGRLGQRSSAEAPPPPSSAKAPGRLLSGTLTSHSLLAATRFSARPLWERGSPVAGGGGSPSSRFVVAFRARPSFLPPPPLPGQIRLHLALFWVCIAFASCMSCICAH